MRRRGAGMTVAAVAVALVLGGCAGVVHRRIAPGADATADGIRYYGSSLYLLIHGDGKGGIKAQVLELPDPTKLMTARPYSTMSSLELTMNFDKGILKQSTETPDTSAIPIAILSAAEKVLPLLLLARGPSVTDPDPKKTSVNAVPAPYLYKVLVYGDSVRFIGGPGNVDILVPLTATTPAQGQKS